MRHDTSRAAGRPSPSRSMRPTSKSPTAAETRDFFSSLLEHALLESRLDRVAPGAVVAVEEVLGGGAAAGEDSVERVEEVGLVTPVGVEHGATAQARAREGKRVAGDVAHRPAGDLGVERE